MTENDPLGLIKSDERFLPLEEKPRFVSRGEKIIDHMFGELFGQRREDGTD